MQYQDYLKQSGVDADKSGKLKYAEIGRNKRFQSKKEKF